MRKIILAALLFSSAVGNAQDIKFNYGPPLAKVYNGGLRFFNTHQKLGYLVATSEGFRLTPLEDYVKPGKTIEVKTELFSGVESASMQATYCLLMPASTLKK